jgi:Gpi18-like mannosyltransferase
MRLPPAHVSVGLFAAVTLLTWNMQTSDMGRFLLPWFAHIRAHGPVGAFAVPFSNYTPPYLYLLAAFSPLADLLPARSVIKLLSALIAGILVLSLRSLLKAAGYHQPGRGAAAVLLLPSVALNAGIFHQCDALWTAAVLMATASALEQRPGTALAWYGLACSIKITSVFAGPFLLAWAISCRPPLRCWMAAPAAFVAAMIPAAVAGWPIGDLATIYVRLSGELDELTLFAPNIWAVAELPLGPAADQLQAFALGVAAIGVAAYLLLFESRLRGASPDTSIAVAALSALLVVGLLPRMHERYFFLADVLLFTLALLRPQMWPAAVAIQIGSTLALVAYLLQLPPLVPIGSVFVLFATGLTLRAALKAGDPASNRVRAPA